MKKTLWIILFFILVLPVSSQPRPSRLSNTFIIDTDCGIDDFRAICYLLARPEINIRAILTSDGSLQPSHGAAKVLSLLEQFGRSDIPVIAGEALKGVNPPWREFNMSVRWGERESAAPQAGSAGDYLVTELKNGGEKVSLVCLGPLTNAGEAFKADPSIIASLDRIVWYNESSGEGFNYTTDRKNADLVLGSGARMDLISNLGSENAYFDIALAELAKSSTTRLAGILNHVFSQPPVKEKLNENHFRLYDDLVAIYITTPDLFSINRNMQKRYVRYNTAYDVQAVREVISDMIKGIYSPGTNVVFNGFPVNREQFTYDVRPIIDSAIARYGFEEWKANVMTDEFHGHLGVFSIVGAKMGIRARELFGVGPDMLDVVTFAGTRPPYSCLTDGIQVSTGATLGMGTIHLGPDSIMKPSAIFTYGKKAYRITLKKEYLDQVDSDINEGIVKFGLLDDGYWKLIRHNALRYWLEWDRNEIFIVEEVEPPVKPLSSKPGQRME